MKPVFSQCRIYASPAELFLSLCDWLKGHSPSSPSLADPELPSEAVLPLATSITAAFGRLKLITNRNQLMTSSYKVRFVSLPWPICVCTMWAELQCSSAKWVTWLRQETQPLFIYRRIFFFSFNWFFRYIWYTKKIPDVEYLILFILWPMLFVPWICIQNFSSLLIRGPICQSLWSENPIDFKGIWPSRMIVLKTNFQQLEKDRWSRMLCDFQYKWCDSYGSDWIK